MYNLQTVRLYFREPSPNNSVTGADGSEGGPMYSEDEDDDACLVGFVSSGESVRCIGDTNALLLGTPMTDKRSAPPLQRRFMVKINCLKRVRTIYEISRAEEEEG